LAAKLTAQDVHKLCRSSCELKNYSSNITVGFNLTKAYKLAYNSLLKIYTHRTDGEVNLQLFKCFYQNTHRTRVLHRHQGIPWHWLAKVCLIIFVSHKFHMPITQFTHHPNAILRTNKWPIYVLQTDPSCKEVEKLFTF